MKSIAALFLPSKRNFGHTRNSTPYNELYHHLTLRYIESACLCYSNLKDDCLMSFVGKFWPHTAPVALGIIAAALLAGGIAPAKPIEAPASIHPLDCMQIYHPFAGASYAVPITDPGDRQLLKLFLEQVDRSSADCTPEHMKEFAAFPEEIAWRASKLIRMPLVAYRLTGQSRFLDDFVQRMDALCSCLEKGPDGFLDWYGKPKPNFRRPDRPEQRVAVEITGFAMAEVAAEFACMVQGDAELKRHYAEPMARYLSLAENHFVKAWDARGCYKDLGAAGAVYISEPGLLPIKSSLTHPHNKQGKILGSLLALYMATGRDEYLVRAIKLGTRFKHCLTLAGDHYLWHYWDPSGPWDADPGEQDDWKHWIGPEHRSVYQSMTLSQAVLLYECGLVFDRADLERFVKTQKTVCWNGDVQHPAWFRLNGLPAPNPSDVPWLCWWLAPFDKSLYDVTFRPAAQQERLDLATHTPHGLFECSEWLEDKYGAGLVACDWLEVKYLISPRWSGDKPAETAAVAAFVAKPEGRKLLKELSFQVKAPGYQAPATPSQMGISHASP